MGTTASERQRAGMLIDARRPADAMGILAPLLAANPDDVLALRLVAMAQTQLGNHRESLAAARAAASLSPGDDLAWRLVATAASSLKQHAEATSAAIRAVELAPAAWRNHYVLVMVDVAGNAVAPRTERSAQEVVRLAPQEAEAHFAAAHYAFTRKNWEAAEREYRTALQIDPDHALAQNNLSASMMNQKKLSAAARGFTAALASNPTLDLARRNLVLAGRGMVHRMCLMAGLAAMLIWFGGLLGSESPESGAPVGEGLRLAVVVGLGVFLVAQGWLLRRALGSRTAAVLRELARERAIVVGAVLLLVTTALLVVCLFVPADPVMSPSGPAVFVAVIGAVASRSL